MPSNPHQQKPNPHQQPPPRIYLDNAATSFPKPQAVLRAIVEYSTQNGASPGRGAYAEAVAGAAVLRRCRERLGELVGAPALVPPEQVIFTLNCTDALNLAIHGTVAWWKHHRPDEPIHIVSTAMEHNSVLRPLTHLAAQGVRVTRVGADADGLVAPGEVIDAIRPETRLVVMVHASNVTGTVQDVGAVGRACRERGVPLLVDAAQTLGHLPVDVETMGIDLLAFPGHKGLMGPAGTGGLYIRPGAEDRIEPVRHGGTGSRSESDQQPTDLPDRFEAGSHNTLGIAGLLAGVEWVLERTVDAIRRHEVGLIETFLDAFPGESAGYRLHGPTDPTRRVGVFAITHERLAPGALALALEARAGVLGRAGLHCAPGVHETLGTTKTGGACRLSVGPCTTTEDIRAACACLAAISAQAGTLAGQEDRGSSTQPASV
ncbi:MAG: aminotransferase class V-fold PLP-dependent enzyme [Planctomycetota bacterium]|nr:aminotransferase class V-fold PLP-dependent enzyme [Planctomycetota bacterium]